MANPSDREISTESGPSIEELAQELAASPTGKEILKLRASIYKADVRMRTEQKTFQELPLAERTEYRRWEDQRFDLTNELAATHNIPFAAAEKVFNRAAELFMENSLQRKAAERSAETQEQPALAEAMDGAQATLDEAVRVAETTAEQGASRVAEAGGTAEDTSAAAEKGEELVSEVKQAAEPVEAIVEAVRTADIQPDLEERIETWGIWLAHVRVDLLDPGKREEALDKLMQRGNFEKREDASRALDRALSLKAEKEVDSSVDSASSPESPAAAEHLEPLSPAEQSRLVVWLQTEHAEWLEQENHEEAVQRIQETLHIDEIEARRLVARAFQENQAAQEVVKPPASPIGEMIDNAEAAAVTPEPVFEIPTVPTQEHIALPEEPPEQSEAPLMSPEQLSDARRSYVQQWESAKQLLVADAKESKQKVDTERVLASIGSRAGLDEWAQASEERRHEIMAALNHELEYEIQIGHLTESLRYPALNALMARAHYQKVRHQDGIQFQDAAVEDIAREHGLLSDQVVSTEELQGVSETVHELYEKELNTRLFEKFVLEEQEELERQKLELFPPQERHIIIQLAQTGLSHWRKIPMPVRWGLMGAAGTGLALSTGFIVPAAAAGFFATKIGRSVVGGATAGIAERAFNPVKSFLMRKLDEDREQDRQELIEGGHILEDLDYLIATQGQMLKDKVRQEKYLNIAKGVAVTAVTFGTVMEAHRLGDLLGIGGPAVPPSAPKVSEAADRASASRSGVQPAERAAATPSSHPTPTPETAAAPKMQEAPVSTKPAAAAASVESPVKAPSSIPAEKLTEAQSVQSNEGISHAVRRQLELRAQANPQSFGLTSEDLENPAKLRAVLNQRTAEIVSQNNMTETGITRPDVKVILDNDNKITFEGDRPTYQMDTELSRPRASQVFDRPKASVPAETTTDIQPPTETPTRINIDTKPSVPTESPASTPEATPSPTPTPDVPPRPTAPLEITPANPLRPEQIEQRMQVLQQGLRFNPTEYGNVGKLRTGSFLMLAEQKSPGATVALEGNETYTFTQQHEKLADIVRVARDRAVAAQPFGNRDVILEQLEDKSVDELLRESLKNGYIRVQVPESIPTPKP